MLKKVLAERFWRVDFRLIVHVQETSGARSDIPLCGGISNYLGFFIGSL